MAKKPYSKTAVDKPAAIPMAVAATSAPLATRPAQQLTKVQSAVPEYLRRDSSVPAAGLENIERDDMTLPRLGLCQSMSPQRKKSDPKFIPGLEEGQFFNTITQKNYGSKVVVVPLLMFKSRILFRDMEDGGGILCQAPDGKVGQGDPGGNCLQCPMAAFTSDAPPQCTFFMNYAVVAVPEGGGVPGIEDMAVASFKSSGLKAAKDWNSMLKLQNLDIFSGFWEISAVEAKNSQHSWYTPVVRPNGFVTVEIFAAMRELYRGVSTIQQRGTLRVDVSDMSRETSGGAQTAEM